MVPPTLGPEVGAMLLTRMLSKNVYTTWLVEKSTPLFDTSTVTVDAMEDSGEEQCTLVELTNVAGTRALPNLQLSVLEFRKLLPLTVTVVPPLEGPLAGDSAPTVSTLVYWNEPDELLYCCPL